MFQHIFKIIQVEMYSKRIIGPHKLYQFDCAAQSAEPEVIKMCHVTAQCIMIPNLV